MATEPLVPPADIDNSRLSTYQLCPMKYHNKYNLGLAEPSGLNARFSSIFFHETIVEWYFQGKDWVPTEEEWQRKLEAMAITEAEAKVKANQVYSIESGKRLFDFYRERFAPDFDRFEILGVENYLVTEWGYGSKPDIRARDRETGKLWTLEEKFSGWDFILEAAPMNPQFLGQIAATGGTGCLVTLVQPNGSGWKNFSAVRQEIEPKLAELATWRADQEFGMANLRRSYETGIWPKHTPHACTSYGGCFFVDLCTAGHPKEMLDRMPRRGDPLDYLGQGSQTKGDTDD